MFLIPHENALFAERNMFGAQKYNFCITHGFYGFSPFNYEMAYIYLKMITVSLFRNYLN